MGGSLWRNHGRVKHRRKLSQVCERLPLGTEPTASQQLWSKLIFLFCEWLEFNPHTANWGACSSYGLSPTFLCWHNRWREDLRHAVSELARCFMQVPNLHRVNVLVFYAFLPLWTTFFRGMSQAWSSVRPMFFLLYCIAFSVTTCGIVSQMLGVPRWRPPTLRLTW